MILVYWKIKAKIYLMKLFKLSKAIKLIQEIFLKNMFQIKVTHLILLILIK